MIKSKVVAMLLAGGQGSRLKLLTQNVAKPAVPFGGKYRIIDFVLSNATNSGINDIGILTQYKPFELNSHIGIGTPWDFDRNIGGLRILPPFMSEDGGRWYIGTANAIFENIDYIEDLDPEFVLILSGDHIYKMDYNKLLKFHIKKSAAVTIASMKIPLSEAYRFGIINVDSEDKIYEFDEKPEKPKSDLASMGIYMFNWDVLKKYLIEDAENKDTEHDFGRNILPLMLAEGENMYAWNFKDYWKDVGTVTSYWEANMDLLVKNNGLDLYDNWRIYTRNRNLPPQYIGRGAVLRNSLVNEGCVIEGEVNNSVIFTGVKIEKGAIVNDSVILTDTIIKKGSIINKSVILENVVVKENSIIGEEGGDKICLVSKDDFTME